MSLSRLGRAATVLTVVALGAAGVAPAAAAEPTYSISGQVFLAGGSTAPAGLRVEAERYSSGGVVASAETLSDGRYTLTGLTAGDYRFGVVTSQESQYTSQFHPGVSDRRDGVYLPVGSNLTNKNFTLPLKAAVSGKIYLGSTATAAADGQADLRWQRMSFGSPTASGQITVGPGGAYSLLLEPGSYVFTASARTPGFQSLTLSYDPNTSISLTVGATNRTGIDAVLPPVGSIRGTVSLGSSGPAGAGEVEVTLFRPGLSGSEPTRLTDASGQYSFPGLSDGSYVLSFRHVTGAFQSVKLPEIVIGAANGRDPVKNVTLTVGPSLSGQVLLDGSPAAAGEARVTVFASGNPVKSAFTDSQGEYLIEALQNGQYRIQVEYLGSGGYPDVWWPLVSGTRYAEEVALSGAGRTADFDLPKAARFTGTVRGPDGSPSVGSWVKVMGWGVDLDGNATRSEIVTEADAQGHYEIEALPGEFWVESSDGMHFEYWHEESWRPHGERFVLDAGETRSDIDIRFRDGGYLQGVASCSICATPEMASAFASYGLEARDPDGNWVGIDLTESSSEQYSFSLLLPGTYRVVGEFNQPNGPHWGVGISSPVTISSNVFSTRNVTLQRPTTERIDGPDRFAVAASIARRAFPNGADVVYVASGENFPDALGAGPAAVAQGGPLLLVTSMGVPAVILDTIEDMDPERIVIVGGTGAISAGVETTLEAIAPVERNLGADRFATSIATARDAFGESGSEVVYIATGLNFPDALSAGPAAASVDAPVVIVNGGAGGISPQLADLFDELGTEQVFIAGSTGAISPGIESSIRALGLDVYRFAGADRYETSALINALAFPDPETLYLAVGTKFPDALAGGVLAGVTGSPLLVTPASCTVPSGVEYQTRVPSKTILLGGPSALAQPATLFRKC